ncbi:MAG: 30S ribosomal protein S15 [Micavibrio sp.]|nr:30S ribosomal protein S15 [Micavibrio sp.]|tara:strand:- start:1964 stop:2233 length:270 start_codon:yes stop_codon:yes gene_type:complete
MSIAKETKAKIIKDNQAAANDTGSAEVQIAIMSERISQLSTHMQQHKKDLSTRNGLLRLVGKRRKLLDYLKGKSVDRYQAIIEKLGIRR